ncbi:hypothetical protein HPG69_017685, partial [Diceros bicornis minor]
GENSSTVNRKETHRLWTVQASKLEKLVEHLVPAFLGSDPTYVPTFLCTYRAFATTQLALDLLPISSILGSWLGQYSEGFFQPTEFPCLKVLLSYRGLNIPGSDLEHHALLLLSQLEHLEATEAESE